MRHNISSHVVTFNQATSRCDVKINQEVIGVVVYQTINNVSLCQIHMYMYNASEVAAATPHVSNVVVFFQLCVFIRSIDLSFTHPKLNLSE